MGTPIRAGVGGPITRFGVYQRANATLATINDVMGRSVTASGVVGGVCPVKLACDDMVVRRSMTVLGRIVTRIICLPGSATLPSIAFSEAAGSAGIYGDGASVSFSAGGANVGTFDANGLTVGGIRGIGGTIDFGGATLTNIAGIVTKPGAYDVIGDPVNTTDGITGATVVAIPVVASDAAKCCVLEIAVKAIAVAHGTSGADNGVFEFRVRVVLETGATFANVGTKYEVGTYCSAGLVGVALTPIAESNVVNVVAVGIGGKSITW